MASMLAGARLVLRRGLRFLPAYRVRPAAVPVRYLTSSARFLTTAVQDRGTINTEHVHQGDSYRSRFDGWTMHNFGIKLKKTGRLSKPAFLKFFKAICEEGAVSANQALLLLQTCGSSLPGVPMAERIEIGNGAWNKLQELGVCFNENHYNVLLKIYTDNEHKFSPAEFLAGMEAAGVQPNQMTYERLIAAYCNEGDIEGASKILGFLKSSNLSITKGVFHSLIKGHARAGDMESAKNVLSVMQEVQLAPGENAYAELLCAYAEKGDIESIKQTLHNCEHILTDKVCVTVIYSLATSGHCQMVPDIFKHMPGRTAYARDLINMCLNLMAQGCGDTALEVAKRFFPNSLLSDFVRQPGNFFIRQCVELNMPVDLIKKYTPELIDSRLHQSPLQFALFCALEQDKRDMALELMNALKEEVEPVRCHYFWPMLASCLNKKDFQGSLQVLQLMQKMNVSSDIETFVIYIADLFANAESPTAILQESGFQKEFNQHYLSALRIGLLTGQVKNVCMLLSSNIPLTKDVHLMIAFRRMFFRYDMEMIAKITKLLFQGEISLQESSPETESVGYFLCSLIANMSGSEAQAREEHLKQYFHHLKNMGVALELEKMNRLIHLLKSHNVPQLIKDVKELVSKDNLATRISELEKELENLKANNLPFMKTLQMLVDILSEQESLEKIMDLTSKHGSDYTFHMYVKVLGSCCTHNKPIEALKIKEELNQREFSYILSTGKYVQLVKVLVLNGYMEDAINILKEMQERNVTINNGSQNAFTSLLNDLAMKGDVAVHSLHEHLVMLGLVRLKSVLCESLVHVHLVRNDLEAAVDAMMKCYKKYKFARTHNLLLKLIEDGETDLLKKVVDFLYNTSGERVMLHTLLCAFLESGNYQEAQKIVETPGLRAIPVKINWFIERCRQENKVEALEKFVEITKGLFEIDREDMYYQLLSLYEKNNEWAKAVPLWDNMKEEGVTVQEKTAELFKQLFRNNGQYILAHIPEFKQESGQEDQEYNHSAIVMNLCKDSKLIEAYNLFLKISPSNKPLTKAAYAGLLKGLLEADLLEYATKVEDAAKRHFKDYSITTVTYNLRLADQVRRDCLKDALVTLKTMLHNGHRPNRPKLNRLSHSFALKGDLASLEEMEELTKSKNLDLPKMDRQYFDCKLLTYFINGSFDEGTAMFESRYTEDPQNAQQSSLIRTLMKNNMFEALEKVSIVVERLANQFSAYSLVTHMFLQYVQADKMEEAKRLLQRCNGIVEQREMLKRHIFRKSFRGPENVIHQLLTLVDEYDPFYKQFAYNCLLKCKVSVQNLDGALEMYERMKAEEIQSDETCLKQLAVLLRKAGRPVPFPVPQDFEEEFNAEQSNTFSPSEDKN